MLLCIADEILLMGLSDRNEDGWTWQDQVNLVKWSRVRMFKRYTCNLCIQINSKIK